MEAKHTPGPWFAHRPTSFGTFYIDARLSGTTLQEVAAVGPTHHPEQQAGNARLIAAAPDLLGALIAIDKRLTECAAIPASAADAYDSDFQEMVRDAITKATGGEG